MTRIDAALAGNLEAYMAEELAVAERAVTEGVRQTAEDVKQAQRAGVIRGGLGRRLATSWRAEHYPRRGESLGAASIVHTKADRLIRAFDDGATIRSRDGFFLAIPTDEAPRRGVGRKRLTPSNFPEHRYGPLRFVYRRTGPSLLVVDDQRMTKAGRFTRSRSKRALATKQGLATVVMFLLYPQVRLKKRLAVDATFSAASGGLAANIDDAFRRQPAGRRA